HCGEIVVAQPRTGSGIDCLRPDGPHRGVREETEHVVHMAGLADVPPGSLAPLDPALWRDVAGVDPEAQEQRSLPMLEVLMQLLQGRREAPVEADGEERRALERTPGGGYPVEPIPVYCQRLFDENVLAGVQRSNDLICMLGVPSRDHDKIDLR